MDVLALIPARGGSKGVPDPRCRGKAWVRPITEKEVWRRFYQLILLAGYDVVIADARDVVDGSCDRARPGLAPEAAQRPPGAAPDVRALGA